MRGVSRVLGMHGFGALWRRLVVVFTLAAFAQAGFVTQTHIHQPAQPVGNVALAQPSHGKLPVPDDPAHCPFCQEYLLAGAYLAPPPVILPSPVSVAFQAYRLVAALPFIAALSHSWHGRGPPLTLTRS